jgi:hypothetical protein
VKVFRWLLGVPLAALLGAFAVASREDVSLGLWPLEARLILPLFLVVMATLLVGFIAGAGIAWLNGGRWRREARRRQRRIETLENELRTTQARLPRQPSAGSSAPARD